MEKYNFLTRHGILKYRAMISVTRVLLSLCEFIGVTMKLWWFSTQFEVNVGVGVYVLQIVITFSSVMLFTYFFF